MSTKIAIDTIYMYCNDRMESGELQELDSSLNEETTNDVDLLLAWLTATLPVKNRLPSRARIVDRVNSIAKLESNKLLEGLY